MPWAAAKLWPTRLAKPLVVRSRFRLPTLRDLRLSSPSESATLKLPLMTVLPSPALLPSARPFSNTWASPPWASGKLTSRLGVSLLPVMVMVRVAVLWSPLLSWML
ncbi:hypothetical protein D3C78_1665350 [compost metagenome]